MEATPKAVVGLMKAKASPKLVEFTEAEMVPTVTEGITKAEVVPTVTEGISKTVPNLAVGPSLLPM